MHLEGVLGGKLKDHCKRCLKLSGCMLKRDDGNSSRVERQTVILWNSTIHAYVSVSYFIRLSYWDFFCQAVIFPAFSHVSKSITISSSLCPLVFLLPFIFSLDLYLDCFVLSFHIKGELDCCYIPFEDIRCSEKK